MRRTRVLSALVLLCLVALASGGTPVETELVGCSADPGQNRNPGPDAVNVEPAFRGSQPGEPWEPLEAMSVAERANAEIWLEPGGDAVPGAREEMREIGRLWNSGSFDDALARMHGLHRFADPNRIAVAVSWRTPLETALPEAGAGSPAHPELDWGPDIRIGTRDSLFGCMFDRSATGHLFAAFPRGGLSRTHIYTYRSTDNGATWSELAYVYWGRPDYLEAWSAACHGGYFQISWVNGSPSNRCWAARVSTTTGNWVRFPGDSLAVIPFESASGDSFRELAVCTAEEVSPGSRIYLFGRTRGGLLNYAWTDSSCRAWREHSTGVTYCDNGLDCTYNPGADTNFLWVTWVRLYDNDSAKLGFGWRSRFDTLFHRSWFGNVYCHPTINAWMPTAVTAHNDTLQMGFIYRGARQVRQVYSRTGGRPWYQTALCDSGSYKDVVEVTGRRGGGFAAGYRYYGEESARYVIFRHADRVQGPYSEPDTVSGHRPYPTSRIRIENLGSGEYGVVWVSWTGRTHQAAWFDRVTLTGIAGPAPPKPVPLGLRALRGPGRARLAFDNPARGPVKVRVLDLAGRVVLTREEHMSAGRQALDVRPEASGVYFALVEAGGKQAGTSFTFAR